MQGCAHEWINVKTASHKGAKAQRKIGGSFQCSVSHLRLKTERCTFFFLFLPLRPLRETFLPFLYPCFIRGRLIFLSHNPFGVSLASAGSSAKLADALFGRHARTSP